MKLFSLRVSSGEVVVINVSSEISLVEEVMRVCLSLLAPAQMDGKA